MTVTGAVALVYMNCLPFQNLPLIHFLKSESFPLRQHDCTLRRSQIQLRKFSGNSPGMNPAMASPKVNFIFLGTIFCYPLQELFTKALPLTLCITRPTIAAD